MQKVYRVSGEWLVPAETSEEAINKIENAVASAHGVDADLESCNAVSEDATDDDIEDDDDEDDATTGRHADID